MTQRLTGKALLAMPKSAYMNAAQSEFFRSLLSAMRETMLENTKETISHLHEDSTPEPDPSDRASSEESHALQLRIRDRERKQLMVIESSLKRIEAGEYGWCRETGEEIGLKRLLARPTTSLCIEAQQRREIRDRVFSD